MKITSLAILFIFVLTGAYPFALADEEEAIEATDRALASLDQQNKASMAEQMEDIDLNAVSQVADEPSFYDDYEEESLSEPSATPAIEPTQSTSLEDLSEDATVREMKKNWEDLFANETSSNRESYTIQPGDSLYVIARKNHTTVDLIKKMNGLTTDTIFAGRKLNLFNGSFSMVIDRSKNTLTLFANDKPIKRYRVSTGKDNSTPVGDFTIVDKLVNPTWFKTGAIYPPGSPDNELGTRWLGFNEAGYGIHGTTEPHNIGKSVSRGCIRMLNKDVEEVYSMVPSGARVIIKD